MSSLRIIVCVKQVVDTSDMKIDPNTKKPILAGLEKKVNDIDKNAVEEAIRIKEKHGGSITVITVGEPDARERLKELLAMGADEAVLIPSSGDEDYSVVTELLAAAIGKIGEYDIILCGEASTDMFSGQVGPRLAGLLGIPQITYVHNLVVEKDKVIGERNLGDKSITMESSMPVVITVTKEINEPRLPSLMQILGAANKPIHEWTKESLGVTIKPLVETISLEGITMERKNIVFEEATDENIEKLVDYLIKEGVVG